MGDRNEERRAYGNLGNDYHSLGDFKKAVHYHELQLEFAKELGNRDEEERAYDSLGNDYYSLEDFAKANHYHGLSLLSKFVRKL